MLFGNVEVTVTEKWLHVAVGRSESENGTGSNVFLMSLAALSNRTAMQAIIVIFNFLTLKEVEEVNLILIR